VQHPIRPTAKKNLPSTFWMSLTLSALLLIVLESFIRSQWVWVGGYRKIGWQLGYGKSTYKSSSRVKHKTTWTWLDFGLDVTWKIFDLACDGKFRNYLAWLDGSLTCHFVEGSNSVSRISRPPTIFIPAVFHILGTIKIWRYGVLKLGRFTLKRRKLGERVSK
jgi:hypothetical protein